jgi:hypothetical protein
LSDLSNLYPNIRARFLLQHIPQSPSHIVVLFLATRQDENILHGLM